MIWLDWLIIAFLLMSFVNGFQEGFVRIGIGMAALIAGFFLASWFSGMVAGSLLPYVHSKALASIAGYLLVFIGVLVAGALIAALLVRMLRMVGLSTIDRVLGAVFGTVRGIVVLLVVAMIVTAFSPKSLPDAVKDSRLAPYVLGASHVLAAATPFDIRDGFNRTYEEMQGWWEETVEVKTKPKRTQTRTD